MVCYVVIELLVALFRLPYMHYSAGLDVGRYVKDVIMPLMPLCVIECIVCHVVTAVVQLPYRFLLTGVVSVLASCGVIWFFAFSESEKEYFMKCVRRR